MSVSSKEEIRSRSYFDDGVYSGGQENHFLKRNFHQQGHEAQSHSTYQKLHFYYNSRL